MFITVHHTFIRADSMFIRPAFFTIPSHLMNMAPFIGEGDAPPDERGIVFRIRLAFYGQGGRVVAAWVVHTCAFASIPADTRRRRFYPEWNPQTPTTAHARTGGAVRRLTRNLRKAFTCVLGMAWGTPAPLDERPRPDRSEKTIRLWIIIYLLKQRKLHAPMNVMNVMNVMHRP